MRYDIPLICASLLTCLLATTGCSLFRPALTESAALSQIKIELACEGDDSDVSVILDQARQDAQEMPPEERGAFLTEALDRARDARGFEISSEAPLPEGWPRPSLPGLIRIKTYPSVRTAWARGGDKRNSQFMTLFRHIKNREIAMTAPVVMEYDSDVSPGADGPDRTGGMAFLYRRVGQDKAGRFGTVAVDDERPLRVVSIGVKGAYFEYKFHNVFATLRAWLDEHPQWRPAGMPRVLGYNSPFKLFWMKYSEVQIPVEPSDDSDSQQE